ncbi:MAG: outer rane efflux protein [Proteobacteria bacterium]|nr:outer rane efflux protein [Pseudomonadota bacterium]
MPPTVSTSFISLLLALVALFRSGPALPLSGLEDPFSVNDLVSPHAGTSPGHYARSDDPCSRAVPSSVGWTLLQVIDQALCHNPKTHQAWATARLQAAQVGVNQAAYLPTLSINGTLSRSQSSAVGGRSSSSSGVNGGNFQFPEQTRVNPSVTFNYLLFDFGGRESRLENARYALDAANWSHDATLQGVIFSAVQAYYLFFAAQSAVEANRASERSSAEALKAAQVRHDVGAGTIADVLQAKTAHSQARVNVVKSEGEASIALGNLANAAGLQPSAGFRVVAPTFAAPDSGSEQLVETLMDEARKQRPDLAAADAQIKAAQANVDVAKSAGLPTLSLVGSYAYNYSSVFTNTENWSVGLQLSVPLFTGFFNTYQIKAAEEQVALQHANREQIEQAVALDVWQAYYLLNTARENLGNSEELLNSATQAEKVALGRYKAGVGNILDLLSAQASLAGARVQKIQSQFTWTIARARLAQAIGKLDLDEVASTLP